MEKNVIAEISNACVLTRTRLISRVLTGIYDEQLRPFGIGSPQFALLVAIGGMQPVTRAEIGRSQHQDRSTLTRNLKVILSGGWAEEVPDGAHGRSRPIALTKAGADLIREAEPAWLAAQVEARALLGKDGVAAVMDIARRIRNPKPAK